MIVNFDIETCSALDLKKVGAWRYAVDASTDVLVVCWDDGTKVERWRRGDAPPVFTPGARFRGFNVVGFDAILWHYVLTPRYGWAWPGWEAFIDTADQAAYGNLPASLGEVAKAVGAPLKSDSGHALMLRLCKPAAAIASSGNPWRHHTAEAIGQLSLYCAQDVAAEKGVAACLPPLPAAEQEYAAVTATANRRGVLIDVPLVQKLQEHAENTAQFLREELTTLTRGAVTTENQDEKLRAWLRGEGVPVGDGQGTMNKEAFDDFLTDMEVDPEQADSAARRVIEIRLRLKKSSLAKLDRLLACTDPKDHRVRGLMRYYGAHQTGRWSGKLVQPQNLPRGVIGADDDVETLAAYEECRLAVMHGDTEWLRVLYGDKVLDVLASMIRACFTAAPGHKLVCADYSAIEARVLACLAGEQWRLDAFRDPKTDIYKVSVAQAYGIPVSQVTKKQRGQGKVMELALGYQGGPGALRRFGAVKKGILTEEQLGPTKDAWRKANPNIVQYWYDSERAALRSLENPRTPHEAGEQVAYAYDQRHLYARLPSGRLLFYRDAWVGEKQLPGSDTMKPALFFRGEGMNGRYGALDTYGGCLVENATQAVARDLLAAAWLRVERAGMPVVLSVHDELLCEVPEDQADADRLCALMSELPEWAAGLPVTAAGYVADRYRK